MADSSKKIKKLEVKRDLCIGASSCIVATATVFELDDENKAVMKLKNKETDSGSVEVDALEDAGIDQETLLAAAESCPTKAIYLYGEKGEQVYP